MFREGNNFKTVNVFGGTGGKGGEGGIGGGSGGQGQGPILNFGGGVQNLTSNVIHQGQGLQEVLYKWLDSPPDTKDRQHELRKLCHEATGRWLLEDPKFLQWRDTPSVLWIKGISGTGKSVLSSTVVEEIVEACSDRSAVAYFYFDFRNERQHMDLMLHSIVWQLSGRSPSPYSSLHQLYQKLGKGTIQPRLIHLEEVLKSLLSELDQTYIVIDGLDECNKNDWKHLITFIHGLCHLDNNMPHLLFTSQPLEQFQKEFKDIAFIELGSAASTDDIRSFIESEVPGVGNWASDDNSAKDVIEQIVQKSNGMFRMAACLLIELGHCRWEEDWEETLTGLPADLFWIYSRFFTRAKETPNTPIVYIQAIFQWLVFSARELTSEELADAIAFRLDAPGFRFSDPAASTYYPKRRQGNSAIFKLLEGLIILQNDSSVALAHSSVKDYILSVQFQQEFGTMISLTKEVSHKFISQTCVRYLLIFAEPKHSMTEKTLPNYPMSLYAAEYWFYHLQFCNKQDQEVLLPLTMLLLDHGSSQHVALYRLRPLPSYKTRVWDEAILPAVCMCAKMGYTKGVHTLLGQHNTSDDMANKDGLTELHIASRNKYNSSVDLIEQYCGTALHLASTYGHLDIARLLIEHNTSVNLIDEDGWSALHFASSYGHLEIVGLLLKHNVFVDLSEKDGWTALHLALGNGHLNIVRLLLKHNASVDLVNEDGWTALHRASSNGHLDIVRLLLEHNASVDLVDEDGWTALHLALSNGRLDIARLLIEHNAFIDLIDEGGRTALHQASSNDHPDVVRLLLEHNASVDLVDKDGRTALHLASCNGHLDIVRLLVEHNASVDLANNDCWIGLYLALSNDRLDIARLLLEHNVSTLHLSLNHHLDIVRLLLEHNASVDLVERYGRTALLRASWNGHHNIVRLLIEHNTSVNLVDEDGWSALHFASSYGHLEIVMLLIKHNALVDLSEKDGWTALHLASWNGHYNIVRPLIKHHASIDLVQDNGQTALHLASKRGYLNIVKLLIEHNAFFDLVGTDGSSALHLASSNGHLNIVKLLIKHHTCVDLANNNGSSALHLASSNGRLGVVELLIEHNASVDLVQRNGWTGLHLASRSGHYNIAKLLIEHNASVDLIEMDGWTALHLASSNGYLNIVRLLIEYNACVDLVNNNGLSALHLASSNGHLDIVRLLIERNASVNLVNNNGSSALHFALSHNHLRISELLSKYQSSK